MPDTAAGSFDLSHISPVWGRAIPENLIVSHGQGAYLHTVDGRKLLDFTSGIGVTNTGHAHPKVVAAVQEQAAKILHAQVNIVYHKPLIQLVESLRELLPTPLDTFYFSNSGAEITEAAVKLAKQATRRQNIIVFSGSFHGRTHLTMAMTTSKTIYRAGHQPLVPGIYVAPYPYAYRYGWDEEATTDFCLRELKHLLKSQTAPSETAAMIIEPVLGEGGYVPPPARFMRELSALCREHGILLIADEVQSGFGRTGKWFGFEHFGIQPDIVTMAKGIASGLPLSGLAASADLMRHWPPGSHGGTYGGNAVACAAGVATIAAMRDEGLVENAARQGAVLKTGLRKLQEEHPEIGDVRGLGLMIATEFTTPDGQPWTDRAKAVTKAALAEGLMLLTCGSYDNIIRWIPPLVISEGQAKDALGMFARALAK
ncbi:MAG TPA: aminotransferase class III-fold pyridoxal phosphate-dependent enzyme [Anaerolineales bacterium]|nr:aminotransferase class III-fold pyridoxal phosphate-dependent enzyme [Anaerolineales bacterium]